MTATTIGSKIRKLRELKNYTQEYMADRIGVGQSSYARFEKDDSDITISKLQQIADILEISIHDILDFNKSFFLNNTSTNSNFNSPNSTVNDLKLVEEIIKSKDKVIASLEAQIELMKIVNEK